jgi:hypothetical protein
MTALIPNAERGFYGPGNPQCAERDEDGRHCGGPAGHDDGTDHANQYGSWRDEDDVAPNAGSAE